MREKRIPTILGFFFLLVSLVASVFLVKNSQVFFLRAESEITPAEIKITNVNAASFTVSWITVKETSGFIKIEDGAGKTLVFADDRDQISGQIGQYTTHYVTAKNLTAGTNYLFKLGSADKIFDNSGQPYEVETGLAISQSAPAADPAYGIIQTSEGKFAEGAIVYLELVNTAPQSTLVRASGNWLITLSLARTADLAGFASYDRKMATEKVFVQAGKDGTATAVFTTGADSPAPILILGKNYDFRIPTLSPSPTPEVSPVPPRPTLTPIPEEVKIFISPETNLFISPETNLFISYPGEGEKVATNKPEFWGKGPAGKILSISLNSQSYFGQVLSDSQGNWSWSPPAELASGNHKLVIRYQDSNGQAKVIERQFTVLAAGGEEELPSFTSTPSATIIPTVPVTPTPLPRTAEPSTGGGVPRSGVLTPTFLVFMMGTGLFLGGVLLKRFLGFKFRACEKSSSAYFL